LKHEWSNGKNRGREDILDLWVSVSKDPAKTIQTLGWCYIEKTCWSMHTGTWAQKDGKGLTPGLVCVVEGREVLSTRRNTK
jgi:hypothetical protein